MKPSEFLGYCARSIELGLAIDPVLGPRGWTDYIIQTLPVEGDDATVAEQVETRPMRFMLAAAIARAEGK